jgi:putative flippase GtrA
LISSKTYIALTKFGIVGGLSFFLDLSIYYALSQFVPTYIAKSTAIVLATILNYQLNKAWTWGQKDRDNKRLAKYVMLYAVSGIMNVISNEIFLVVLPNAELILNLDYPKETLNMPIFAVKIDKFFAVIFATIVGMVVNFIGQKLWVFKEKEIV